jgi:uncharacterized protein with PIN domain
MKKFLLDENLGKLAKWLRFLGYDAAIYKKISVNNKIRLANREKRIYLTRDKKTAKLKKKFSRILIKSENYKEQLKELKGHIEFDEAKLFTVCPHCNRKLKATTKEKVKKLIPEYIYQTHDEFMVCYFCGRVFWKGTHYQKILNTLKKIF